ncbi:SAM-dependent methyltransferase [Sphingomonas sp. HT-1]|uniref:SAM-dependent methyltransferase n=1 Tax=unclassified Sphingomonas TaxID=196159 RepID=UPI0002EB61DC|nr:MULTISPECIES: SAM-dependent methyltransferase [unclassified Sphingomonas]KTF67518.1 hypothetical protein ATB93_17410 [Sphingomonas sp. WG]
MIVNNANTATRDMTERWEALAAEIAAAQYDPACKGRLMVMGSGLAFTDFLRDAEDEIRAADALFHCVYDKVTQVWLGQMRPDAYDLRILYNDDIERHLTYVRMAQAMLHHVRLGQRVVAIFYGHPGVFAMPAHRAIHIARHEGHEARMRPGISALDYLIADLGFDPALPGFASFEATDLLLRRRRLDTTLHIVLWQVGVVGELGYTSQGFANRGFDVLARHLSDVYGPDWTVTHYIAPQYVGMDALVERIRIGDLATDANRAKISSLSTFYIEPRDDVETDAEISVALGCTKAGDTTSRPFRIYDYRRDGPRERATIRNLAQFRAPAGYRLTGYSPEYQFMLDLSRDAALQAEYRRDPATVVQRVAVSFQNERKVKLLAIPHPKAIDAALSEEPEALDA